MRFSKKILIAVMAICTLSAISSSVFSLFVANAGIVTPGMGEVVECHCKKFIISKCKSNGGGPLCAQSKPGGNIQCQEYNGNC